MKEERMLVLKMLESGKISSQEAERLLKVLTVKKDSVTKEDVSNAVSSAFSKTAAAIDVLAKKVGTKAENVAKEVTPAIRRAKDDITRKAEEFVTEIKNKKKDDLDEDDIFDDDFWNDDLDEEDDDLKEEEDDIIYHYNDSSELTDDDFVKDAEIRPFVNEEKSLEPEYKAPMFVGLSEDEIVYDPFNPSENKVQEDKEEKTEYRAPIFVGLSEDEMVDDPFNTPTTKKEDNKTEQREENKEYKAPIYLDVSEDEMVDDPFNK